MQLAQIQRIVFNEPWAIMADQLAVIDSVVRARLDGGRVAFDAEEFKPTEEQAQRRQTRRVSGGVAVLPLMGVLAHRMNMITDASGGTSMQKFGQQFDELVNDDSIGAIVLDVDSPGGTVAGTDELADKMFAARGRKPVIAVANTLMASAAYWIGTAADEVVITPSGDVGSVGVAAVHISTAEADKMAGIETTVLTSGKFKGEDNPFEPLTDEARENIQERLDAEHDRFVAAVARHRGVSASVVRSKFGQGRVLQAEPALAAGMVDRIDTFENVLAGLMGRGAKPSGRPGRRATLQRRSKQRARAW
jgi:signal peptide peptidase SppA